MTRRINWDALLFCVAWALLAAAGFAFSGLRAGLLLSAGLFPIVMGSSALVLSRTGSFAAERALRWGVLVAAFAVLVAYLDLAR